MEVINRCLHHHLPVVVGHDTTIPAPRSSSSSSEVVYVSKRCLTCPPPPPFVSAAKDAYQVLGVSQSSSLSEIKSCFRKLAKLTHPDLSPPPPPPPHHHHHHHHHHQFLQILAAYEILSDSEKRAHYDKYLLSQRSVVQTVETRLGYFDVLERDFYSALHAAYYGPEMDSMDLLPDCFEAEERSATETPEVLHIVSGRDLFGIVRIAERIPKISRTSNVELSTSAFADSRVKHLHWYHIGDEASVCECRCRRARLPPSRFWLFEPRCGLHDIGGWNVETFGRDKKGRNVLSQRYWDGLDTGEQFDKPVASVC
ncbi:hypothetical protein AgCh_033932 [Apium graveolens]